MDTLEQEIASTTRGVIPFAPLRSAPLEGTVSAAGAIARVRYHHDAMIDLIIANPNIKQNEIAERFGHSAPWVSRIFNSDAFQARLAARKADLVDPTLLASIDEKLRTLASISLDVILEKLETTPTLASAMGGAELAVKALGYGARPQSVAVQQNFVVALPQKAASAVAWAQEHSGQRGAVTLDLAQLTNGGA